MGTSTNAYIGYIGAALVVLPIGALIAKYLTTWIGGFKPRYVHALISTVLAYVVINLGGLISFMAGSSTTVPQSLQLLVGLAVLSCSHFYFLRSEAGARLSPGKTVLIALCQIIGAVIVLMLVLAILLAIKRLFA